MESADFFASSSLKIPGIHFVLGKPVNKSLLKMKHSGKWKGHPRTREGWERDRGLSSPWAAMGAW